MKRLFALLALVMALAIFTGGTVSAQSPITVTNNKFVNNFRKDMSFAVEAQSNAKITNINLTIQITGVTSSSSQQPTFTPDTKVSATYTWNLNQNYLPPGVFGQYWWTIKDSAGNQLVTQKQDFRVDDPSQKWQKLSNDRLALYWYQGGQSFGQALFDKGNQAMDLLQKDTGVTVDHQIQIFIYGNRNDFFNALDPGASEWTGGRAFPEYSEVLINIEPSNLQWGLGATTHELTHQVIHQRVKGPLGDLSLPHWMDEGLAVYYEDPGNIDPQFSVPLRRAIQNDTLPTLRSLNSNFPADSAAANLAYGESWSVVDFIFRHYGKDKMAQLLNEMKTGGFYDDIFTKVLGVDTDGLENQWRQDVGAKPRAVATRSNAAPTAFPTFGLSSDSTPVPSSGGATSSASSAVPATTTTQPVAVVATAGPSGQNQPQQRPPASPVNPISNICGGVFGIVALGVLLGIVRQRSARARA